MEEGEAGDLTEGAEVDQKGEMRVEVVEQRQQLDIPLYLHQR